MKRHAILGLVLLSLVLLYPRIAFAQSPGTGFPPFGSFTSGSFDTVNNQNLNVIFSMPVVNSPGRGTNLGLSVVYNSQLWGITSGAWTPVTDQLGNPTFGWGKDFTGGKITYSSVNIQIKCFVDGTWYWDYRTDYRNYKYVDVMGTVHGFPTVSVTYNDCLDTTTGTFTGYAGDASGYYLNAGSPDSPYVISPGGIASPGGTVIDTNGNYTTKTVVSSTENDWTDTAGRVALKVVTIPASITYSFLDPTGAYQSAVLNLQNTNIKTAFNCSATEYTGSAYLPVSLVLPNQKSYTFTYEPTPGFSGYFTGRVKKVTLPTGGYYEYDYGATNDGVNCADGSTVNLTRKMSVDGVTVFATWTFLRDVASSTTTVTAPTSSADDTVFTFDGNAHETSRKMYQGSHSGGTLLRTVNTTWASNGTPATRITILEDNSTQNEVETTFDSFGNLQLLKQHDWGTGTPGGPVRTTTMTYVTSSAYTNLNIVNLLATVTVADSQGTIQSRTDIAYDGSGGINTPCVTGAVQHDDTGHGCSFTTRGLPTLVKNYPTDPVGLTYPITKNFTYDSLGNLRTAQVNCCQFKTWNYSATTNYTFPDSVVSGSSSPQLTTSATYNSYTGAVATSTDENGKVITYAYVDPGHLNRLTGITRPDNAQITYAYDDTNRTVTVATPINATSTVKQVTSLDGLGRQSTTSVQDSSNNTYSIVQTQYDVMGRAFKTSNPYTTSAQYWTETDFDALGRPTQTILPDISKTLYGYATNTVTVTDPAGKQRMIQTDGLGRMAIVFEPDVTNGNLLTLQTLYTYTVLDALATVTQGAQTRAYSYDHMGRLTSAATPETSSAPIGYQYDTNDLVTQRTDPRGVITTYGYDTLNRLHQISYNVGSTGVAATPTVTLTYGTTSAQNNNGRLLTMTDGVGSETYSYDVLGETTQLQKVLNSTTYTSGYTYNQAGELTSITYPSGRVVQQSYDAIGRLCAIAQTSSGCSSNTNPYATGYGYNTAFELTGFNYANGVAATYGYSADRLQMTSLKYLKGTTTLFNLSYSYGTTGHNNGQISGITDSVDNGRSTAYTYDALARLTGATTTGSAAYPQWGLSFTYDRYANRTAQSISGGCVAPMTCPTNPVAVSTVTNRITSPGYGYDANGNMTNDGSNTLTYDAENHLLTSAGILGSGTYIYDGNGLRVKKVAGSTTTVYAFSGSKVIAEYVNGAAPTSPTREYIYTGGALLAKIESGATQYYHDDQLSTRVATDSSGNKIGEQGHFPYGETWYLTNTTTKWQFTTYERDAESGNDQAIARYHVNRLGRFSSPDLLAGSTGHPQSLNRYPYVANDPTDLVDPLGLDTGIICGFTNLCASQAASPHPELGTAMDSQPMDSGDSSMGFYTGDRWSWKIDKSRRGYYNPGINGEPGSWGAASWGFTLVWDYPRKDQGRDGGDDGPQRQQTQDRKKAAFDKCLKDAGTALKVADFIGLWGVGSMALSAAGAGISAGMQWMYGKTAANLGEIVAKQAPSVIGEGILATAQENALFLKSTWATVGKLSTVITLGATAASAGIRLLCAKKAGYF